MANKKDTFAAVVAVLEAHSATPELTADLAAILEPKSGGAAVVVADVYNEDKGTLLCSVSNVWLPATLDFFYEDKSGKSPFNGLRRLSRQAESIRKTHTKTQKASEAAIMNDVLDGEITPEDGKEQVTELKTRQPDFSTVTNQLPAEDAE